MTVKELRQLWRLGCKIDGVIHHLLESSQGQEGVQKEPCVTVWLVHSQF